MIDTSILAAINGGYQMPDDAGPAWRAAVAMGIDMTLIECNLELPPWERILQNDRALAMVEEIGRCNPINYAEPR
ncbi:MAG: hypothetical protein JWM99_4040 [Verrucomicrobiales bacterium]|nr:hypothetical protein [Verrucomicrobiales bacterium]